MIHPKKTLLLFSICLLFVTGSKNKISNDERLNYYVMVASQTRDVPLLVKNFNAELVKIHIENKTSNNNIDNAEKLNSIRVSLVLLTAKIGKKLLILNKLPTINQDFLIKESAIRYLKATRGFLVFETPRLIDKLGNKATSVANNNKELQRLEVSKILVETEASVYPEILKIYRTQYGLTNSDLEKYDL